MRDELRAATAAVDLAGTVVNTAVRRLAELSAENGKLSVPALDRHQAIAYDLAHAAAAVEGARVMCGYGQHGEVESMLARAYVADAVHDVATRALGRSQAWGVERDALAEAMPFVSEHRAPEFLEALADQCVKHGSGPTHLSDDFELVGETFRRFAEDKIRPVAEHVHRTNADVPEEVIRGLAELGGFGLSVPEENDGFATGGESDYMGMVVATEELSRGSLGIGGSLVTRPEILTRALVAGGTEEQKRAWLPRIASGEVMVGIMVTEPDYGSDVAGVKVTATPAEAGWVVNGVKTWATFAGRADVLMLLARTDPDRSSGHRGLSILMVEKPRAEGHAFAFDDGRGGHIEGRAIDTIGYRGMHSYEVAFDNWFVPADNL
ncbi:MAG: (2S)-methylsuccinyl-CoA dehydrogenase, partial [Actinomycetota bacterium]|nr:(2S)-methylsuccinyl-CoA dehydrogenase [Actinomycetota bacterium]